MSNWRKPKCVCTALNPEQRHYVCGWKLPDEVIAEMNRLSPVLEVENRERELWKKKDWERLIFFHQRHCRLRTFIRILKSRHRDSLYPQYWQVLGQIWTDTETVFGDLCQWRELFSNTQTPHPETFMTPDEQTFLASLPERLTIYRGYNPKYNNRAGYSWTLDSSIAERLGKRDWLMPGLDKPLPCATGAVLTRDIDKDEVFAYSNRRRESEILVRDPHFGERS